MAMMERSRDSMLLGVLMIAPYFMSFILLSSFAGRATFESAMVFFIVGVASLGFCYMAKDRGYDPFQWMQGMDFGDVKLLFIGYAVLLGSALILTPIGGPILSLMAAGVVLSVIMYYSKSIMVPWLAHAMYNITVVALAMASILPVSFSAIYVPVFQDSGPLNQYSSGGNTFGNFLNQAFLQVFAVAFSEESMKIALAQGVALLFFYDPSGNDSKQAKIVPLAISAILWVLLHTIISYQIKLF